MLIWRERPSVQDPTAGHAGFTLHTSLIHASHNKFMAGKGSTACQGPAAGHRLITFPIPSMQVSSQKLRNCKMMSFLHCYGGGKGLHSSRTTAAQGMAVVKTAAEATLDKHSRLLHLPVNRVSNRAQQHSCTQPAPGQHWRFEAEGRSATTMQHYVSLLLNASRMAQF